MIFTLFFLIVGAIAIWLALVIYRLYATSSQKFIDDVTERVTGRRSKTDA